MENQNEPTRRPTRTQGMKWCMPRKRLAIYLRDGMACAYCGAGIENGVSLSLDHLQPYSLGGSNHEGNLITCCKKCNSSRGNRTVEEFVEAVGQYLNVSPERIFAHIAECLARPLDREASRKILDSRPSWAEALQAAAEQQS
jgi:hypothetical protein